jgi:P2-related tail formation protein
MKSGMISEYILKELEKLIENNNDKKRQMDRLNCSTENRSKFNCQGTKLITNVETNQLHKYHTW